MKYNISGDEIIGHDLNTNDVHPDDCSLEHVTGDIPEEISQYQMIVDQCKIKPTKYKEGYMVNPKIGGLHYGKIPVQLQHTPEGRYGLKFSRIEYLFHSFQGYVPLFKRLSMKVGVNRLRKLGALPAMITNLLVSNAIHPSTLEEKEEINELLQCLMSVIENIEAEINKSKGNNCVRLEGFFESLFNGPEKDWQYPELEWAEFLVCSAQMAFFNVFKEMCGEVMHVLDTTFLQNPKEVDFSQLSAEAKGILVVCSEMAVTFTEFHPFSGKCINQISKLLRENKKESERRQQQQSQEDQVLHNETDETENEAPAGSENDNENHNLSDVDGSQTSTMGSQGRNLDMNNSQNINTVSQDTRLSTPRNNSNLMRNQRRNQSNREVQQDIIERNDGSFRANSPSSDDNDDDEEEDEYFPKDNNEDLDNEPFTEIVQENSGIWNIPGDFLVELRDDEKQKTGLTHGIKNVTMVIPEFTPISRLSEDDMRTRDTSCLQVFVNESSYLTNYMNHYVYFCNRVLGNLWHYQLKEQNSNYRPTVFELPNFAILGSLSFEKKKELIYSIGRLTMNVYVFEWWTIVKDRIGKYIQRRKLNRTRNKLGGAHLFPTTKKQLKEFVKDKQFLKNDLKRDPQQIESVGEKK